LVKGIPLDASLLFPPIVISSDSADLNNPGGKNCSLPYTRSVVIPVATGLSSVILARIAAVERFK